MWNLCHNGTLWGVGANCSAILLMLIRLLLGPTFWDQPVLTFFNLEDVPQVAKYIPNEGLNVAFMWVGAVGMAFNIITRYSFM